ncbi:MAG: ABC transporter ATP-binding protein [Acidobacteria bacterium]|nr:ABC transporter ATP-binding protein [Acidobacteriota bacterium]MCB9398730.1 ABC transporter ATP-binding protein [Acidobacteriota bacterium]
MIRFEGVHKAFGSKKVLNGLDFELKPGSVTGYLGPNGAGKTTSMRILTNALQADQGQVLLDGTPTTELTHEAFKKIGYLPEHTPLYPDLTVWEFLEFSARVRGMSAPATKHRVGELVEPCGLKAVLGQAIATLSKGYRQRVGLAQALLLDPPILVLDEPTTGLDPNQIREILKLIGELGREKTVLLSTHILSHVPTLCDQVLVLNQGHIVFNGTPQAMAERDPDRSRLSLVTAHAPEQFQKLMESCAQVQQVQVETQHRYTLIGSWQNASNVRLLAEFLQKHQIPILELSPEPLSLDRAFHHLTEEVSP